MTPRKSTAGSKKKPQPIRKAWKFCPHCGAPAEKPGKHPFVCSACQFTHFFGPVSAVGGIATDPSGRVLLLVRARDPGKGMYGLPGGFVDPDETAEDALQREVLEEVQLEVTSYRYLVSYPNEYTYHGFNLPVTDMFFVVEVASFDNMVASDGEIESWHFCHPRRKELNRMAFDSNRRALEVFLKQR